MTYFEDGEIGNTNMPMRRRSTAWSVLCSMEAEMDGNDGDDDEDDIDEINLTAATLRATRSEPVRKHTRDPYLFRNKSACKWDEEQLDRQQREMQRQMAFLCETQRS